MKDLSLDELSILDSKLKLLNQNRGFEAHPFKIGWYNQAVDEKFRLPYPEDTLAYVILSLPSMFEKYFLPVILENIDQFQTNNDENFSLNAGRDPLDKCMVRHFEQLTTGLTQQFGQIETLHDFELAPNRRPKILVQTAGHVSGAVRFYRQQDCPTFYRNQPDRKVYPVCLHPVYGGWFALRGVCIFAELTAVKLQRRVPPEMLGNEDEIANLLELYNEHWRDWRFRDVIQVKEKYSENQMKYFDLPPGEKRFRFLKELAEFRKDKVNL